MSIRSAFKSKFKGASFDKEGPSTRDASSVLISGSGGAEYKPDRKTSQSSLSDDNEVDSASCEFRDCINEDAIIGVTNGCSPTAPTKVKLAVLAGKVTSSDASNPKLGTQASTASKTPQIAALAARTSPFATPATKAATATPATQGSIAEAPFLNGREARRASEAFRDREEKAVYELQLTQLQEQLVAAMIESQNLAGELKTLKDKTHVDRLHQQLEYEKERNKILAARLRDVKTKTKPGHSTSESDEDELSRKEKSAEYEDRDLDLEEKRPARKRLKLRERSASVTECSECLSDDSADISKDSEPFVIVSKDPVDDKRRKSSYRLYEWLLGTFYEMMADFTDDAMEEEDLSDNEGEPLTVRQLKDNLKRFYTSTRPVMSTLKGISGVLSWETPSLTVLVLSLYVYSVWHGWLFPVTLFLLILRLSINWLKSKGIITNFHYLPHEDREESEDRDSGVSDRFNLVLQVARKVQNGLGDIADGFEKVQNLLMWRHPTATGQLMMALIVGFIMSCWFSGTVLFQMFGFYAALKLFVIDFIYHRYPRVRLRHDTTLRIWRELPTNAELNKRAVRAELHQYILPPSPMGLSESSTIRNSDSSDNLSNDDRAFLELFSLPVSECPLPAWQGGRRCTMINKEKSLTSAFKSGKLYLTRSFFCFERTKSPSPKNLIIPLADIIKIEKAKPYSWMPGGGMSLEVHVLGINKPLMFGALLNRDEVYDSIMAVGLKAALVWAPATSGSSESTNSRPSSPTQSRSPSSMVEKLKLGIQFLEDSD